MKGPRRASFGRGHDPNFYVYLVVEYDYRRFSKSPAKEVEFEKQISRLAGSGADGGVVGDVYRLEFEYDGTTRREARSKAEKALARVRAAGLRIERVYIRDRHTDDMQSNPTVSNAAVEMYRSFQGFEPRKIGAFSARFAIPDHVTCVGPALNVMYRSDKNDPSTGEPVKKPIDYIHDHEDGVHVYRCDRAAEGGQVTVPSFIKNVDSLVLLGECLGFTYDADEGAIEATPTRPLPELYTIPSGRALLVVQSKAKVLALIWGGSLGVEARGIVY